MSSDITSDRQQVVRGNLVLTSHEYQTGCVNAALQMLWPSGVGQA